MVEAFGKSSTSKWSNVVIKPGDRVRLMTPGGGGWGDPGERKREFIDEDLAEGWVTLSSVREDYDVDV
jgi:N-methylhydantoinase B/oxoprolinase/acetone carboxylase alpha subunit